MDLRRSIPAVLLLTLAVPSAPARSIAPSTSESVRAGTGCPELSADGESGRFRARRRQATARNENGLSAESVGRAGDYLACHARGDATAAAESVAAWERFHESCDAAIRRFAGKFRGRGVNVEDCTQEVWTDLITSLPRFTMDPARGRFTSWLYTIVRSKATDILRRQMRDRGTTTLAEATLVRAMASPSQSCEIQSEREGVRQAMGILKRSASDLSYRVLHLRCIDELSVAEVARTLGLSSAQVWAREHRMKRQLKGILVAQGMGHGNEVVR